MPRLKRTHDESELSLADLEPEVPIEKRATLKELQNMWEFASLMQYIYMFGHIVKIDDNFDIEVRRISDPGAHGIVRCVLDGADT